MYCHEKLQKRAARIILDKNYNDYYIRRSARSLCWIKIDALKEREKINLAIQVYKYINGLSSSSSRFR